MTTIEEANVQTVLTYIDAYNRKDIDGMVACLADTVEFENLTDGHVTLKLTGKTAFQQQAEQAAQMVASRQQTLHERTVADDVVSAAISYKATLAVDLPDGKQAGETLLLKGHSVFVMKDRLIARLTDIG